VRETVPDLLLERADEIELVDLPPDDLIQRLREGKVYMPDQAAAAIENFFRKGNLIALANCPCDAPPDGSTSRCRTTAGQGIKDIWPAGERIWSV